MASPHGNLASAAPFLVLQTEVPVSVVPLGLEGRDHKHPMRSPWSDLPYTSTWDHRVTYLNFLTSEIKGRCNPAGP